jgi:crotonobetainyl-CoA:carnitine CoA-transferase CaiB-like acyl-CoA transferase
MAGAKPGILRGIKVLDFTRAVAGGGDGIRLLPPFSGESWSLPVSMSPVFIHCNAGKKSTCIDLKRPEAIDLVKRLVPQFDVVVENFTPHVMRSLGLAYEDLRPLREDLVMCSVSGYGSKGPLADSPATDPVGQAMGGMLSLCGEEDGYPYQAGNGIADSMTATTAALAIVSALLERLRSGEGQHIDIGMMDTLFAVDCAAAPSYVASRGEHSVPRGGRFHHLACPWGVFKGPQNRYLVVMAAGDIPWERLARFMGRPELIDDPAFASMGARLANREKVHEVIEEFLQTFETAEEAHDALARARIIVGTVLDPWEVANHPQLAGRDMVHEVAYPLSEEPVSTIGTALHFSKSGTSVGRAPFLGEHNRPVLRSYLGLSDDELERLHQTGVLYEHVVVPHLGESG